MSPQLFSVFFAVAVTAYFWRENIKGIEESSDKNLKIMGFVTVVGAVLIAWALVTVYIRGFKVPPFDLQLTKASLGWMTNFPYLQTIGLVGIFMAFGHSILALSGLETLAQVYREIEDPKIINLKRAALAIFLFSLVFNGGLTFLASSIIPPDLIGTKYLDNLLSGLARQAFVVASGSLMLVGRGQHVYGGR